MTNVRVTSTADICLNWVLLIHRQSSDHVRGYNHILFDLDANQMAI